MPAQNVNGFFDQGFVIVPSDVEAIAGPNRENGKPTPYCTAFQALTSGNVVARFKGSPVTQTFPVIAGTVYPYSLSFVFTATTATLMGLI